MITAVSIHNVYDSWRLLVLLECTFVAVLYGLSIGQSILNYRRFDDEAVKRLALGRISWHIAAMVLLGNGAIDVVHRINHPVAWHTPLMQLSLLFLLWAWRLVDRVDYKPPLQPEVSDAAARALYEHHPFSK